MPKFDLTGSRERATRLFAGFTSGQKTMLALAAVGTVVAGMFFMKLSSSTQYAPLYSNLTADSAADVTAALDSAGISYQLGDGGSSISVPRADVNRVRIDLAASGLPEDGAPGYALLDEQGITTSEFRQRVDYQRAMEGELSRTIKAIDGVDNAIVHLVMPESDLFSGDSQHPSASVLVETRPDRPLAAGQVQAVVHLVASSIEGLQAEHVTVADNAGRVLSASGEGGGLAAASDVHASQTAGFEAAMASRIQELLLPVTGPHGARVSVTAALDYDRRSTTSETFGDPGTAPVVQESTAEENFDGSGNAVGGVLGPDGAPITPAGGEGSTYDQTSRETVFANDKTTEVIEHATGDVQRMSVAVLIDEAAGIDSREVQRLVEASAGFDTARGDIIEVSQMAFDTSGSEAAEEELARAEAAEAKGQLYSLLRTVASVLIVAIVLFLAWRSHKKGVVARYPVALPMADPDERGLPSGATAAADLTAAMPATALPGSDHAALLLGPSPADLHREEMQTQISDLVDRQPDDVAQVLRTWMAER